MRRTKIAGAILAALLLGGAARGADPLVRLGGTARRGVDRGCDISENPDGSLRVSRQISPSVDGKSRAAVSFRLKNPLNLNGKALSFELCPGAAFSRVTVTASNADEKLAALRGDGAEGELPAGKWTPVLLQFEGAEGMTYGFSGVSGKKPDRIGTLFFSVERQGPHPAGSLSLAIRNVKTVPAKNIPVPASAHRSPAPAPLAVRIPARNPFSELGGLSLVMASGGETVTVDPDSGVMKVSAKAVRGSRPQSQHRVSMLLSAPLDLRGRALIFDMRSGDLADFCRVFLYNRGKPKAVWAFHSDADELKPEWDSVVLQRNFSDRLNWHRIWSSDEAPSQVDRIDFVYGISSPRMDGQLTLELRQFRVGNETKYIGNSLKKAVKLDSSSRLVAPGSPAPVVLHPDSDAGRTAARTIVDAVRRSCGVELESRPGVRADGLLAVPAIMLGNVWSNPAFTLLYGRRLVIFDGVFPGAGHYVVTTLKEPVRRGVDVLAVGASDDAGLLRAAEAAAAMLAEHGGKGTLVTPQLFRADFGSDQEKMAQKVSFDDGMKYAREVLASGRHMSLAKVLAEIGDRYHATHDSSDARLFAAVAKMYAESAAHPDPRRYGGPWGQDSDFAALGAISAFDLIEHDPALTDQDRLDVTLMFNRWVFEAVRSKAETQSFLVAHNHGTHGALGSVMAGLYFSKYYPEYPDGEILLRAGDRIFAIQNVAGKVHDDCNSYQWLTWEHVMRYAALRPDDTVLRNGVARAMADMLITTMDNDRYQTPFGDTGLWTCYRGECAPIAAAACLTRDPVFEWAADEKYRRWRDENRLWGSVRLGNFSRGDVPETPAPAGYDGVHVLPLAPEFYRTEPPADGVPAAPKCFDKLSFRGSFDRGAFYMLTDGVNVGGHGHADAMSVERLMLHGRQWLGDNHYYQGAAQFHNTFTAVFDGLWTPYGPYAELTGYGADPELAAASMKMPGADFDWIRHLVWLRKSDSLAVLDVILPHRDGQAVLRQKWHCVGSPSADGASVELSQQGAPRMRLECNAGLSPLVTPEPDLAANWQEYPYAPGQVHAVEISRPAELRRGEPQGICTLWHGSSGGSAPAIALDGLQGGGVAFTLGGRRIAVQPDGSGHVTVTMDGRGFTPGNGTLKRVSAVPEVPARIRTAGASETYPELTVGARFAMSNARCMTAVNAGKIRFAVGGADGTIALLDGGLRPAAHVKAPAPVNSLDAGDVDGDGRIEIIAGLQDETVRAYTVDGGEIWSYRIPFYRCKATVNAVRIADLDGDGHMEILIANDNWRTIAVDGAGKELWHFETVREGRFIHCADLDGDGRGEALVGTKYFHVTMLSPDGLAKWKTSTNTPGCLCAASVKGTDRWRNLALGTDGGEIMFFRNGVKAAEVQTGDQVPALTAGSLNARNVFFCGSLNGLVYCYEADGSRKLWSRSLGSGVTALTVSGDRLWAGSADGRVFALSTAGEVIGCRRLSGRTLGISAVGDEAATLTSDGLTMIR